MKPEECVEQWIAAQQSTDRQAMRAQAAFATGRFDAYWEEQGSLAQARLDALYVGNTDDDSTGPRSSAGDGEPGRDSGGGSGSSG